MKRQDRNSQHRRKKIFGTAPNCYGPIRKSDGKNIFIFSYHTLISHFLPLKVLLGDQSILTLNNISEKWRILLNHS